MRIDSKFVVTVMIGVCGHVEGRGFNLFDTDEHRIIHNIPPPQKLHILPHRLHHLPPPHPLQLNTLPQLQKIPILQHRPLLNIPIL